MSPGLWVWSLAYRGNQVSGYRALRPCPGVPIFCLLRPIASDTRRGWSDPLSGLMQPQGSGFPLRTTDGERPVQRLKSMGLKEVDPS